MVSMYHLARDPVIVCAGLHQGAGHLGGGLHPGRDDQQQAALPGQALPRPGG